MSMSEKMLDESEESYAQQMNQFQQYQHLLRHYTPYFLQSLPQIGKCLSYNSFLTSDLVLNLCIELQTRRPKGGSQKFQKSLLIMLANKIQKSRKIGFNYQKNLIKYITNIEFPILRTLDLCGNKIESLDGLSRVWAPNLLYINLSGNLISNIRGIQKFCFSHLQTLDLTANLYSQIPDIIPGIDIQLDSRVIEKRRVYKAIFSRTEINRRTGGLRMMDYFR